MLGIIAVADGEPRLAILWLVIAMVIDGIDGPFARAWDVSEHLPRIDGYALDLIVDYVTCVVIPVIFLHQFEMLPAGTSLWIGAIMLFVGALWMSRTDQMTNDHWFNGFPGEWNVLVPTMYLLDLPADAVAAVCVLLAFTQLTDWKFVHPMQVVHWRPTTMAATATWLGTILWMTVELPDRPDIGGMLLVACSTYIVSIGVWRTIAPRWRATAS